MQLGHLDAATEHLTRALEMCAESEFELRGDIMNRFGTVLAKQGNNTQALDLLEKSLNLRIQCFGTGHASVANTYLNMGAVEMKGLGNFKKALDLCEKALEIYLNCLGPAHVRVADTYVNMGAVQDSLGNFEKALELYEKALEIYLKCVGPHHEGSRHSEQHCNGSRKARKVK